MLIDKYDIRYIEAGCDEAGRGCLAGPVFAAAVILPEGFFHPLLDDSKKMSLKSRELLRPYIEENAVSWGIGMASEHEIDQINILNASILAMHRALDNLNLKPDIILVDGNRFKPYQHIQYECIIKGDGKFMSIAAASVLAKTWRDEHMLALHQKYPHYGWDRNKGYPTPEHKELIHKQGLSLHHRLSFSSNIQIKIQFSD
ncbi:MAG: ribonuclease HII [Bacteroidales bacterium]|jgi:ribonuclease HII|nr:ribonuclease HII [Bacteroidales bacterium]